MYLPPNPLKGNREKFDNVQISRKSKVKGQRSKVESRKSKVESSRVSNYSEPETQNPKLILSSNLQILKSSNPQTNLCNPKPGTCLYQFKFDFKQQACRSYFVIVVV